jgi:fluoride exporter
MERFLWVCLAGALGTGARYLVGSWALSRFGHVFPLGTLIVNLVGCFLMGLVVELALRGSLASADLRVILTTGFLGGLTTYSAFNQETARLFRDGTSAMAFANVAVTVLGCLLAGWLGTLIAARVSS